MSKIEVMEAVMPACWASALINGDYSSFSLDEDGGEAETKALETELSGYAEEGWYVVSTKDDEDPWFTWSYALHGGTAQGGDVLTYILHRQVRYWHLNKVPLDKGGYDSFGSYYGAGPPALWRANPKDSSGNEELMFRAVDLAAAQAHVRTVDKGAKFFRKGAKQ